MLLTSLLGRCSQPKVGKSIADYENMVPFFEREGAISKNIFQICLQKGGKCESETEIIASLPENFQQNILSLRSMNPKWKYNLIDNDRAVNFIRNTYGDTVLSYYERIDDRYGAARADMLRYLLLYRYGGVYIDLKCGLTRSLEDSIRERGKFHVFYWDCFENGNHHFAISDDIPEGEMLQGFIVSPAGHGFLRAVIIRLLQNIDNYNPYVDGVGFGGVVTLTGPAMYTSVIYDCCKSDAGNCCFSRPFADFGFTLYAAGKSDYITGQYQKQMRMSDYRKLSLPVVKNCNIVLNAFNVCYLKLLKIWRGWL